MSARVTYILADGQKRVVDVPAGTSIMQAALSHNVPGIVAECGGQLMCATCHVYVEAVVGELPDPSGDERDMLELAAAPVTARSRLSCQLVIQDGIQSISLRIPEKQI